MISLRECSTPSSYPLVFSLLQHWSVNTFLVHPLFMLTMCSPNLLRSPLNLRANCPASVSSRVNFQVIHLNSSCVTQCMYPGPSLPCLFSQSLPLHQSSRPPLGVLLFLLILATSESADLFVLLVELKLTVTAGSTPLPHSVAVRRPHSHPD
jgi:hypothetical protein